MSFDLDKFTAESFVELLGKKADLLNLAKHYKLSEIKSLMRKHEIQNILVQYFVDEEIFNETALSLIVDVQSVSSSDQTIRNSGKREKKRKGREREGKRKRKGERRKRKGKRERRKRREREVERIPIKDEGIRNARKSKSAEAKD